MLSNGSQEHTELVRMSEVGAQTTRVNSLFWGAAALGVGGVGALVAFGTTQSLRLSAFMAMVIFTSLCLGWWAARRAQRVRPEVPRAQAVELATAELLSADALRAIRAPAPTLDAFTLSAIEATPTPVIIIDPSGRIITTNQAARTRFSIGNEPVRFNHVIRLPDIIEAVEAVSLDRQARTLSIETRVPVDRYERVSIGAFMANGVPHILVSVLDETEARMSERMRADFLANASHELRTPLAAIIGFIETLRGPARNDTQAREQFLEVMQLQADRMSRLISDLLSLSRIELNERVAPTGHSNIAAAAQEVVDSLTPNKKKRVVLNISQQPMWVLGDRDEMAQVLLNLIDNALKYSRPDSEITVSLSNDLTREAAIAVAMRQWNQAARLPLTSPELERNRLYCVIRVENEGKGIERQHLPRLSERFFRIEDSASGKSGTGLGLAIVKHIVSRHRGGLLVESELARGSAFSVYLPQPFESVHNAQKPMP